MKKHDDFSDQLTETGYAIQSKNKFAHRSLKETWNLVHFKIFLRWKFWAIFLGQIFNVGGFSMEQIRPGVVKVALLKHRYIQEVISITINLGLTAWFLYMAISYFLPPNLPKENGYEIAYGVFMFISIFLGLAFALRRGWWVRHKIGWILQANKIPSARLELETQLFHRAGGDELVLPKNVLSARSLHTVNAIWISQLVLSILLMLFFAIDCIGVFRSPDLTHTNLVWTSIWLVIQFCLTVVAIVQFCYQQKRIQRVLFFNGATPENQPLLGVHGKLGKLPRGQELRLPGTFTEKMFE